MSSSSSLPAEACPTTEIDLAYTLDDDKKLVQYLRYEEIGEKAVRE